MPSSTVVKNERKIGKIDDFKREVLFIKQDYTILFLLIGRYSGEEHACFSITKGLINENLETLY